MTEAWIETVAGKNAALLEKLVAFFGGWEAVTAEQLTEGNAEDLSDGNITLAYGCLFEG